MSITFCDILQNILYESTHNEHVKVNNNSFILYEYCYHPNKYNDEDKEDKIHLQNIVFQLITKIVYNRNNSIIENKSNSDSNRIHKRKEIKRIHNLRKCKKKKKINKNNNTDNHESYHFQSRIHKYCNNTHKKLVFFRNIVCKDTILYYQLYNDNIIESFIDVFSKTQRHYRALSNFAHICKYKLCKNVIETDLCGDVLNEYNPSTIAILQENKKYLFSIHDLKKIITNDLTNASNFFPDILITKNPYNNIVLTKTHLYNIYFFMKQRQINIPELFHGFFMNNWDINIFESKYECILRSYAIKNRLNCSDIIELYYDITDMWDEMLLRFIIHKEFPMKELISIMKPYLELFYKWKNGIKGLSESNNSYLLLRKHLIAFKNYNPSFGYITNELVFGRIVPTETTINKNHIDFNNKELVHKYYTSIPLISSYSSNGSNTPYNIINTNVTTHNDDNTSIVGIIGHDDDHEDKEDDTEDDTEDATEDATEDDIEDATEDDTEDVTEDVTEDDTEDAKKGSDDEDENISGVWNDIDESMNDIDIDYLLSHFEQDESYDSN